MHNIENVFNDFSEISPIPDFITDPEKAAADAVSDLDGNIGKNSDESSWLEDLFEKIFSPVTDLFHHDKEGVDTETISLSPPTDVDFNMEVDYDIEGAAEDWHWQTTDHTCAVCSQEFIINEFTDLNVTEDQLSLIAESAGWLSEEGTPPEYVGNLLELFGIDTVTNYEGTFADLKNTLDQGGRVIVGVDSSVLWTEGFDNYPVTGADHALEVIGIDNSDSGDIRIIINDSGDNDGCAKSYPIDEFMEAWSGSGFYMVSAFPKD